MGWGGGIRYSGAGGGKGGVAEVESRRDYMWAERAGGVSWAPNSEGGI